MATAKDCHALTSYYVKKFKEKMGREPNVNRHAARWNFDSVLQGLSGDSVKELIDYYFTTPNERNYDLDWFFYNYHKLVTAKSKAEADAEHRRKIRAESKERAERWRASGKQRITND
jgi:hypothetical protein